ncbi:OsmC family peroxiredoxin [Marinifilum sp. JC120]|nr:OsmC family peroxiredoxin [Marinifilum sp. JC120]
MNYLSLILTMLISLVLFASPAFADSGSKSSIHEINVELEETAKRIVSGKVRGHTLLADQPQNWGGNNIAPTPPESFAFAVGACVISTTRLIATLENRDVKNIRVTVKGGIDFAKALGKSSKNRSGYSGLEIKISFESTMTTPEKEKFIQRVVERCPMCDNVSGKTSFIVSLN